MTHNVSASSSRIGIEDKKRPPISSWIHHPSVLTFVVVAQIFFTTLFLFKISANFWAIPLYFLPWSALEAVEIMATIGMLIGVVTSFLLIREGNKRMKLISERINAASGEFHDYLQTQFNDWSLTPTEKTIALFVIKGFSNQEIADLRGTTESTVKSQISAIFRKSGVNNRQQLVSWVVEDLIETLQPGEHPADNI